jgi:hypothetical protein
MFIEKGVSIFLWEYEVVRIAPLSSEVTWLDFPMISTGLAGLVGVAGYQKVRYITESI